MKFIKFIFLLNIMFWMTIGLHSIVWGDLNFVIKLILFFEPVIYIFFLGALPKKIKIVNLFALFFTFGNMIFSITDQVGLLDIISFFLSAMAFVSVIRAWVFKDNLD